MTDHCKLVCEIGASSIALRNERGALPLNKPRTLALIGNDAGPGRAGSNQSSNQDGKDGILAMGWGSRFPYLISAQHHTLISWLFDDFNLQRAAQYSALMSAVIVFANSDSGEDYITVDGNEGDRKNLTAWHSGDQLILPIAAQNNNTAVVVHSVGPLIVKSWIDHPNITAVLWAGLPGRDARNILVNVLYGAWNPSGRLPYTVAKQISDYFAQVITTAPPNETLQINYTEGLQIDYR